MEHPCGGCRTPHSMSSCPRPSSRSCSLRGRRSELPARRASRVRALVRQARRDRRARPRRRRSSACGRDDLCRTPANTARRTTTAPPGLRSRGRSSFLPSPYHPRQQLAYDSTPPANRHDGNTAPLQPLTTAPRLLRRRVSGRGSWLRGRLAGVPAGGGRAGSGAALGRSVPQPWPSAAPTAPAPAAPLCAPRSAPQPRVSGAPASCRGLA
jgi:hypothetical protein